MPGPEPVVAVVQACIDALLYAQRLGDDLRGADGAAEWTGQNKARSDIAQGPRYGGGLSLADLVERWIGQAA